MFAYRGSTAMITGASKGLGAAFAKELAGRGMNLVLIARSIDALQDLADSLGAQTVSRAKLSRLNEPLQRPAQMSSFGANSVDASERLAARRSMERRLSGFHNGAAPAHTEGLRVSAVRWRQARPVRSATGPPTDAGKLARRHWEDYPVRGSVAP
jgi:NAD(P)-dependent dehydrogenase (short-subunit alcohol dehydrogenase family)